MNSTDEDLLNDLGFVFVIRPDKWESVSKACTLCKILVFSAFKAFSLVLLLYSNCERAFTALLALLCQ